MGGGDAFLDLTDPDLPFAGGVNYRCMPPAKRFREMHLLSGGEQTLAALALCFAVHAYQRPPVLIMDEIDAPLDSYNVQSVRRYLRRSSAGIKRAKVHHTDFGQSSINEAQPASNLDNHTVTQNPHENGHQIIVISLKDELFCWADSLIGICKEAELEQSATVTWDLS